MPTAFTTQVTVADFNEAVASLQAAIGVLGESIASRATGGMVTITHREPLVPRPGPYVLNLCQLALFRADPRVDAESYLRFLQSLLETFLSLPPVPPDA